MAARGSAPGERRGGRQKGTPNKRNAKATAIAKAGGLMPLDFLLAMMRARPDPKKDLKEYVAAATLRFEAAKAAAPYCHPRLANVELGNKDGKPLLVALASEDGGVL